MLVLKIILLVILALLLLVLLALFLPVTVFFSYNKKVAVRVYYCGIPVFSTARSQKKKPEKPEEQPKEKAKKEKKTKDKPNLFKEVYGKLGFNGTVRYFTGLLKILLTKLGWVLKRLKIRKLRMALSVAGSDAAQTAIEYGQVCSAVYPVLSLLFSVTDCNAKRVDVSADFNHTSSNFSISFAVRALPIHFAVAALAGLWEYKKYKGVNLHE